MINQIKIFLLRLIYWPTSFLSKKTEKIIIRLLLKEKCFCGSERVIMRIDPLSDTVYVHCKDSKCKESMNYIQDGKPNVPFIFYTEFESSANRTSSEGNIND